MLIKQEAVLNRYLTFDSYRGPEYFIPLYPVPNSTYSSSKFEYGQDKLFDKINKPVGISYDITAREIVIAVYRLMGQEGIGNTRTFLYEYQGIKLA